MLFVEQPSPPKVTIAPDYTFKDAAGYFREDRFDKLTQSLCDTQSWKEFKNVGASSFSEGMFLAKDDVLEGKALRLWIDYGDRLPAIVTLLDHMPVTLQMRGHPNKACTCICAPLKEKYRSSSCKILIPFVKFCCQGMVVGDDDDEGDANTDKDWVTDRRKRWNTEYMGYNIEQIGERVDDMVTYQVLMTFERKELEDLLAEMPWTHAHFPFPSEVAWLLELALWKFKIAQDTADSFPVNRLTCRVNCGADIVIPNVLRFIDRIEQGRRASGFQRGVSLI